jgi:hypothetical protein
LVNAVVIVISHDGDAQLVNCHNDSVTY